MKAFKHVKIAALMTLFVLLFAGAALAAEEIGWHPRAINKEEVGVHAFFLSDQQTSAAGFAASIDAYLYDDADKMLKSSDFAITWSSAGVASEDKFLFGEFVVTFDGLTLEYGKSYDIRLKSNDAFSSLGDYNSFTDIIGTEHYEFQVHSYAISAGKAYPGGKTVEVLFYHNDKADASVDGKFEWELTEPVDSTDPNAVAVILASGDGTAAGGVSALSLDYTLVGGTSYDLTLVSGDGLLEPYECAIASFFVPKTVYEIRATATLAAVKLEFFKNGVKDIGLAGDFGYAVVNSGGVLHASGTGAVAGGEAFFELARALTPGETYLLKIQSRDPAIRLYLAYLGGINVSGDMFEVDLPLTVLTEVVPTKDFWNLDELYKAFLTGFNDPILTINFTVPTGVTYDFSATNKFLFWLVPKASIDAGKPASGWPAGMLGAFIITATTILETDRTVQLSIDTSQAVGFPLGVMTLISNGDYRILYQLVHNSDVLTPSAATAAARAAAARGYALDDDVWGWADVTIGQSYVRTGDGVGCDAGLGLFAGLAAAGAAVALRRKRG